MTERKESYDNGFRFTRPKPPETPEAMKARLFEYHQNAGSLGHFYDLYPESRPKGRDRESGGRGR